MTGRLIAKTVTNEEFVLSGGTEWYDGAFISLHGQNYTYNNYGNTIILGAGSQRMNMYPSGTWTWTAQAVQLVSDARLKQQINQIDDKLLDAWEDVDLVQFKYNDAVDQKGDTARLHTGYVVQQIDEACKSHDLDISEYGLYCHEEYPERTEEVTIENEDGTTSKETKVIEPAREYYSLRYTETLVVECAYLRREVSRLKQQNENLEQRLKMLEQSVK